jgi:hypothetical protein
MKHIKLFEKFKNSLEHINEEWFPQDTFMTLKSDKDGTILEFYGNFLVEIKGNGRTIEKTVNMFKKVLENPNKISEFFNINGKLKKRIEGFTFQIDSDDDLEYVKKEFNGLGKFIYPVNFYGSKSLELELDEPLILK